MGCHHVIHDFEIHPVSQPTSTGPKHSIVVFFLISLVLRKKKDRLQNASILKCSLGKFVCEFYLSKIKSIMQSSPPRSTSVGESATLHIQLRQRLLMLLIVTNSISMLLNSDNLCAYPELFPFIPSFKELRLFRG